MYDFSDKTDYPALTTSTFEAGEPLKRADVEKILAKNEQRFTDGEITERQYKSTKAMLENLLPLFIPEFDEYEM